MKATKALFSLILLIGSIWLVSELLFSLTAKLHTFGYQYPSKSVVYYWYLFHVGVGAAGLFWYLLVCFIICGCLALKKWNRELAFGFGFFVAGIFCCVITIGPPSGGLADLDHRGTTKFDGHIYHWAQIDNSTGMFGPSREKTIDLFYRCDLFGLVCKLDDGLSEANRQGIIHRIENN